MHPKTTVGIALIGLWLILAGQTQAEPLRDLPAFKAEYDANIKGMSVRASRQLRQVANDQYELHFEASALLADMSEHSSFTWQDGHVAPMRYQFKRNVLGKKHEKVLHFDPASQRITSIEQGRSQTLEHPRKALDNLSYQLQLQYDLLTNRETLTYQIVDKGKVKTQHFTIVAHEVIDTALGELKTVKVQLNHKTDKRQTYIWFAQDWHYLLVRFEQYEKGKKDFAIQVTDATINNQPVSGL